MQIIFRLELRPLIILLQLADFAISETKELLRLEISRVHDRNGHQKAHFLARGLNDLQKSELDRHRRLTPSASYYAPASATQTSEPVPGPETHMKIVPLFCATETAEEPPFSVVLPGGKTVPLVALVLKT